ncbi:MAG TPA: peptide-methionine (S)-S-oxide reductase MsrA [Gemmatimonadales bacterium]|jgi:peptide-methionine (S)-S-oxide reductase
MTRSLTLATLALMAPLALSAQAAGTPAPAPAATQATAVFAGGCFWGIEGLFEHVKGVISATAGYAGGTRTQPSYEDVGSGETGHAESVRVVYDPAQVTYRQLLEVFFLVGHDPTEFNRQGPDVGTQYRSIAFYADPAQHQAISAYIAELSRAKQFHGPIVTQVTALKAFYDAEGYHQHYMALHPDSPYIEYNDAPKLVALKRQFPALYREPGGVWAAAR